MGRNLIGSPWEMQSGDVALYSRTDPISLMVRSKTWSRYSHVEMAFTERRVGSGLEMFTARLTEGVGFFPLDQSEVALVLRPVLKFDAKRALWWARTVVGQDYDVLGLAAFWFAELQGQRNRRQFCSEAVARCLRKGGADVFGGADCDAIAPAAFARNSLLQVVWRSDAEWDRWYRTH